MRFAIYNGMKTNYDLHTEMACVISSEQVGAHDEADMLEALSAAEYDAESGTSIEEALQDQFNCGLLDRLLAVVAAYRQING